jgi:hypothetical protein
MREQAAIKEASQTGNIEQRAVAQKQEEKQQSSNKLFDVESARQRIREGLLGYRERLDRYRDPESGEVQTQMVKVNERDRQLCNEEAAGIFMDEANSFLNHNTITTYLPASTIENKCKGTLQPIYKQIWKNFHLFDINGTEDAEDIVSIIRNPMIDAMNKGRGGRMIKNQEQIRVEKESISREGGSDDDDNDGTIGGLF